MRIAVPTIVAIVTLSSAQAAPGLDPHIVQRQIQTAGADATVNSLDRSGRMDQILTRIGRGDGRWIALAPTLAPGTDGADAEGLSIELARALPVNPAAVLRVIEPGAGVLGIEQVCGTPFIEPPPGYDRAYLKRALKAVARISRPDLLVKRQACLAELKAP